MICTQSGCTRDAVYPIVGLCNACYVRLHKRGELPPRPPRAIARVCPPDHPHAASLTCYNLHQCRCDPCYEHRAAYDARSARDRAYGRPSKMVDAAPVRAHVLELSRAGIGRRRLVEISGVADSTISALRIGKRGKPVAKVRRETAERILAVAPALELLAGEAHVVALPYVRRLQALVAAGWSQAQLADRLGMTRQNFRYLVVDEQLRARRHQGRQHMTARRARDIVALYDELAVAEPPPASVTRARNYAAARGWPSPWDWAAYDDDFERAVPPRRAGRAA